MGFSDWGESEGCGKTHMTMCMCVCVYGGADRNWSSDGPGLVRNVGVQVIQRGKKWHYRLLKFEVPHSRNFMFHTFVLHSCMGKAKSLGARGLGVLTSYWDRTPLGVPTLSSCFFLSAVAGRETLVSVRYIQFRVYWMAL